MDEELNFQLPPSGFGAYLQGILPSDQCTLAGAFSTSMLQIRNVQQVDPPQFAQVVYSSESTVELPLINGTNVPTDLPLANQALNKTALGSGVYGSYTMSDFYGCMSGLSYPLKDIHQEILDLQTATLETIYKNLYLAAQWQQATVDVQYTTYTGPGPAFNTFYHVTGLTLTNKGGGYLRENNPAPSISISNGGTATLTMGTDPQNIGSNGGGQYGRVVSVSLTSSGSDTTTIPTATITAPPGPGWPGMNSIIQTYIDAANAEIYGIQTNNPANFQKANLLNQNWNITGRALKIEQRARYIGIAPVPIPYDSRLSEYPTSQIVFVDSLPQLAQNTFPHMSAQTLENISDLNLTGGQSIVGMMRQERNQRRLQKVGIDLDNNIDNQLEDQQKKLLMTNGTLPGAADGIPALPDKNGNKTQYTNPPFPPYVKPVSVYDPNIPGPRIAGNPTSPIVGKILANDDRGPYNDGTGPDPNGQVPVITGYVPEEELKPPALPLPGPYPEVNIIPPELNTLSTSSTLLPNTYDVQDAIDKVVECNCDCWMS